MTSEPRVDAAAVPRVSLIVCTTGRDDRLPALRDRLVASLAEPHGADEVILVDNSPNGLPPDAVAGTIRVVRSALPGLSRARTVGCIHAGGDVLVFTDDDVEFQPSWAALMATPVLDGRFDVTVAPIKLGPELDHVTSPLLRGWLAEANLGDHPPRLVGAGFAVRRSLLGLGLWDQQLGAGVPERGFGEETLFELMVQSHGARVGLVSEAAVIHHPDLARATASEWRRTAVAKGRSEAYVAYHWAGEELPHAALRALRRRLRLLTHRLRHRSSIGGLEEELRLLQSWAFAHESARERGRPRVYRAPAISPPPPISARS